MFNISGFFLEILHSNVTYQAGGSNQTTNFDELELEGEGIEQFESFLDEYAEGLEFSGFTNGSTETPSSLRKLVLLNEFQQSMLGYKYVKGSHTRSKGPVVDLPNVQRKIIERKRKNSVH